MGVQWEQVQHRREPASQVIIEVRSPQPVELRIKARKRREAAKIMVIFLFVHQQHDVKDIQTASTITLITQCTPAVKILATPMNSRNKLFLNATTFSVSKT
jgi:hypothetical protein